MRCKWKFLSRTSEKTSVFLVNINKFGGHSFLSFSALLPGFQAWCLEAQQK